MKITENIHDGESGDGGDIEILIHNIRTCMPKDANFTYTRGPRPALGRKELDEIAAGKKRPKGVRPEDRPELWQIIFALSGSIAGAAAWTILALSTPPHLTMEEFMRREQLIKESEKNSVKERPGSESEPIRGNKPQDRYRDRYRIPHSPDLRPSEREKPWLKRPRNF